ncbi:LysR family transcriptional regulator [Pseudomonas sp. NPDC088444]|uniref:LysR family transcriptional regulator n=1 Tax=Pseudomonas sp. NPDC088444 TaxID=3364456 RepID=UPI00384BBD25
MADKKRTDIDWQDVRVFLALGRHGSLSAAARALSVNHATIARRIQSLESTMGEKLIERRPEGYMLTPAGIRTMTAAGDMEAAVQTLGRGGADASPRGLVRVNAPPALAQGFLVEQLSKLPAQYPGLDIDLATDLRSVSLERHQADIAVRIGRPLDGHFIAKALGHLAFGFYGTEAVCQAVEDGGEPSFISFNEENADLTDAQWLVRHFPQARIAFRASHHVAQAMAAKSGSGLALLPHYVGRQTPGLRICPMDRVPPTREVWLLMRPQDKKDLPIRTVADFLQGVFVEQRGLFVD